MKIEEFEKQWKASERIVKMVYLSNNNICFAQRWGVSKDIGYADLYILVAGNSFKVCQINLADVVEVE